MASTSEGGASGAPPFAQHQLLLDYNPEKLVEDYKAAGHMDKLKTDIRGKFEGEEFLGALRSQIENIVRTRVQNDEMLTYMPQAHALADLQQNINRDGVVDRFISEEFLTKMFSEHKLKEDINGALESLIAKMFPGMETEMATREESKSADATEPPKLEDKPEGDQQAEKELPQDGEAMDIDPKPASKPAEDVGVALE